MAKVENTQPQLPLSREVEHESTETTGFMAPVAAMAQYINPWNTSPQKSNHQLNVDRKLNRDFKDANTKRIAAFVADQAATKFVQLDDEMIANSSLESLLFNVLIQLQQDLEDQIGLSEQLIKSLRLLEEKSAQIVEESHGKGLKTTAAIQIGGALAPLGLQAVGGMTGLSAMEDTANPYARLFQGKAPGLVGKGISSTGTITEGWRQQAISVSQMEKQQASKLTDQERAENQQIMKRLQDVKASLDQILQLLLQAARMG